MNCSAKDVPRDPDLSGAANYKQMLLPGPTQRPPSSRHWGGDRAPQRSSSNECQVQAFVQSPSGQRKQDWVEKSHSLFSGQQIFLETSRSQWHVTVLAGFYSAPGAKVVGWTEGMGFPGGPCQLVGRRRSAWAVGTARPQSPCTAACKRTDLGRVL